MSEEINKKVNQLRNFFKKNQAANHPIKNHPLAECDEYVKGLYFDMLCVMAQYENEDTETQNKFIQRIMSGCNETMPIAEHIKRAMSLTVENITEFLKQCKDNNLSDIFFIDSLLISCGNGAPNKKQVEFIAEIADVLGFDKAKTKFMSELAVAILEQDSDKYDELMYEDVDVYNLLEKVLCYTKSFVNFIHIENKKCHYYYSLKLASEPILSLTEYTNIEEVIFENQFISNCVRFSAVKKVVFKNCIIQNRLRFDGVVQVIMNDCHCSDTTDSIIETCDDITICIMNSTFHNCQTEAYGRSSYLGGVFYLCGKNNNILIENCEFRNCYAYNGAIASRDSNYTNGSIIVKKCCFISCNTRERGLLFNCNGYYGENNTIVNSNKEN